MAILLYHYSFRTNKSNSRGAMILSKLTFKPCQEILDPQAWQLLKEKSKSVPVPVKIMWMDKHCELCNQL